MLKKRNAMNVKKSVSFNFKRKMNEENAVFANMCSDAKMHATYDMNKKFMGANIHHLEHCAEERFINAFNTQLFQITFQYNFSA